MLQPTQVFCLTFLRSAPWRRELDHSDPGEDVWIRIFHRIVLWRTGSCRSEPALPVPNEARKHQKRIKKSYYECYDDILWPLLLDIHEF